MPNADIEKLQKLVEELKLDPNYAVHNIKEVFNHLQPLTRNFTEKDKWQKLAQEAHGRNTPTQNKILDQLQTLSDVRTTLNQAVKPKRQ
ncbi:MAG: hypothetical protein HYX61_02460 [Gammaproteobacteria bacterium]|jgi:GTP1/Obg family GTP-binding protein|nr:hypothetical protein [Gammaproteobacteria bacterium]